MIVNKFNKSFQTRSDMPNNNWLNDDWYCVEDGSELANKIIKLYPRFDFIIDENNNLINVKEREKTETEIKQERLNEIQLELEQFDKTVDRQWEDYYIDNNKTPVDRIANVIKQKEELRAEYQTLEKELKEGEVVE